MKWVCADSARAEQRAANDYREKQEKAQQAKDLSTQAAMDEKLAMRKALDSNNAVTYNKYTGEYTIATDKLADIGKWNVTTADGKVIVDPQVETKLQILSKAAATMFIKPPENPTLSASILSNMAYKKIQSVVSNLIEAGLLRGIYGTKEYVLNNPHTNEVGISLTGAFGGRLSYSIGIISDCYGNLGLIGTPAYLGGGTPSVSFSGYSSWTNAPEINSADRMVSVGGSIGAFTISPSVGADLIGLVDSKTGQVYYGYSTNAGVSILPAGVPVEMHGSYSSNNIDEEKLAFQMMVNLVDVVSGKNREGE